MGSTATAKGGPGEAQHKGCPLMRQLAPVKRPDKNKREGRGSTDGGEEVWPFSLSTLLLICIETCAWGWGPLAADSTGTGEKRAWVCHNRAGRRWWRQEGSSEHLPGSESHDSRSHSKSDVNAVTWLVLYFYHWIEAFYSSGSSFVHSVNIALQRLLLISKSALQTVKQFKTR